MNNNLTGIVLCGGLSSRMGSDKGLLKRNDRTWVEISMDIVSPFVSSTYVSINQNQHDNYSKIISQAQLIIDFFPVQGPLKGILTCHTSFSQNDFLVIACDMIDMKKELVQKLVDSYVREKSNYECFTYTHETFFEPLCSIYTSKGLAKIRELAEQKLLESLAIHAILKRLKTYTIPLSYEDRKFFRNYNTPEI